MDNLPFWVVESERFCRFVKSVNPMTWIPIRRIIINLVTKEYQQAISHIKALQTAKGLIHLTFDSWTSHQNDPYLGINDLTVQAMIYGHRSKVIDIRKLLGHHGDRDFGGGENTDSEAGDGDGGDNGDNNAFFLMLLTN
jgi:hypothetical protein